MEIRKEDTKSQTHFRSERFCLVDGQWHFLTRVACMGPYSSKEKASLGLQQYLDELVTLNHFQESRGKAKVLFDAKAKKQAKEEASRMARQLAAQRAEPAQNRAGRTRIRPAVFNASDCSELIADTALETAGAALQYGNLRS